MVFAGRLPSDCTRRIRSWWRRRRDNGAANRILHAGVFQLLLFIGGRVDLLKEIDVVGIVQLIPVGDGGDGAAATLREGGDDLLAEVGVDNFANADHS